MKYLKIIVLILAIIITILILNFTRIIVSYYLNKDKYIEAFDVQGNTGKYVPQGLVYSEKYDIVNE